MGIIHAILNHAQATVTKKWTYCKNNDLVTHSENIGQMQHPNRE